MDTIDKLEECVDSATLAGVVGALVSICTGKAEHIRTNWQDYELAKRWDNAAVTLQKAALNLTI